MSIVSKWIKKEERKMSMNYKSLIKTTTGDLVILGVKDTCKTTLLMHIARELRQDAKNHVYIMETFPKWIHEFDNIAYMTIKEQDVEPKENSPYLEENSSIIQWSKDYIILNANDVIQFLKTNKDGIFLIECEDMEKISAFMTFVIYQCYRKQYLRAKAENLETINEHFWFMVEESHNLLDSTVIAKKTFNKLRKIQNEFRNLKMHMVCVALRLQDLSPKIRAKMSILLARVSLDDYQLKVRNLLRNSKYRNEITQLEKGKFIFPELDLELETKPFQQIGKPYEYKPKPKPQEPQKKKSTWQKVKDFITFKLPEKPIQINETRETEPEEKEPEHDITYGEDTFDQEDDEYTEESEDLLGED